jgi:acetyl-CoA carboxylase beta subunit
MNNKIPALLDGEGEFDYTNVRVCPKCGNINLSIDITTNKTICTKCNEQSNEIKTANFQKINEDLIEKDNKEIEQAIKQGTKISIEGFK